MAETYWERKFWEPDIETMPRKELRELQKKKLFRELVYAYENAPFYHELYDKEKVDVYKIRTIEDFQKYVPSVDKEMFREYREKTGNVLGGACCLSMNISSFRPNRCDLTGGKLCRSTGTTGLPTCFMYTERDTKVGALLGAREYWRMGERPNDRMVLFGGEAVGWHGALIYDIASHNEIGAFLYIENMGAMDLGLKIAKLFDVNILYLTLTNVRPLSQMVEREGTTVKDSYLPHLKVAPVTGEMSKSALEYHASMLGVPIWSHWFVTDVALLGGGCLDEALACNNVSLYQHFPEDMQFVEIFPPGSDKAIEGAEFGELVTTNLFSESMAYVRFRTEDLAQIRYDPCPYCGYTHMQGRIMSRVVETVNVKGKLINMAEIEDITQAYPETRFLPTQLVREEPQPQDKLRIRTCYNAEMVKEPEQFRLKLEEELKKQFGVDTAIDLISPEDVKALYHKFERVIKEKRQS
jgi:phenylacetate-CoA ligase